MFDYLMEMQISRSHQLAMCVGKHARRIQIQNAERGLRLSAWPANHWSKYLGKFHQKLSADGRVDCYREIPGQ